MTSPLDVAMGDIDWRSVREEVVTHLRALIALNTVNPPGNELVVARYLERVLGDAGIETELIEQAPGKGALHARVRADSVRAGEEEGTLLLLAHMDVVPVEAAAWSVDPFAGIVRDGYLYGRGAIDDKGMLAVELVTLLLLQRLTKAGVRLRRDVALLATSDEETGGEYGMGWLAQHRPDVLEAGDAINEGGRVRIVEGRLLYAAIQCAEKTAHRVRVLATGPSGHAAVPLTDNALWRLGRALAAIGAHREPLQLIPTTRDFFGALAVVWPDGSESSAMTDLACDDPQRVRRGESLLAGIPSFDALLRAGISATSAEGGGGGNVIPGEARAMLDVRTLPGQAVEEVIARLRTVVDDPRVEISVVSSAPDSPVTPHDSAVYAALAATASAIEPAMAAVPYLSTGVTDSAVLRRRGVRCYGILPFPLEPADEARMHGHDERVPLAALEWGARLLWGTVTGCALRQP